MTKSKIIKWVMKSALKVDLATICDDHSIIEVEKGALRKDLQVALCEAIKHNKVDMKELSAFVEEVVPRESIWKKATGGRTKMELAKSGGKNLLKIGLLGIIAFFAGKAGGNSITTGENNESVMITDESQM